MSTRRSRVPLLVLAHLGLLPFAACKEAEAPVPDPGTQPTASASASAPVSASATVSATSTATTTATPTVKPTASTKPTASAPEPGCKSDNECPPYEYCAPLAGGPSQCIQREHYNLGRPLVVDGEPHVAPYTHAAAPATSDEIAALHRAAREEHASIAAFARTISELMALGAPTTLLAETQRALADEIRHTELTLEAITALTGETLLLGALPAAAAPLRSGPDAAAELLRDVFRGGAVGETLAAAEAERARLATQNPLLRELYSTIEGDEARHAALAFKTLRWLVEARPELAAVLADERRALTETGSLEARLLVGPIVELLLA